MSIRKLFQSGIGFFSSSGFQSKGKEYINLMERLQRNVVPLTPNQVLEDILSEILTPEQADFLSKFPMGFVHVSKVNKIFKNEGYESEDIVNMVNELRSIGFIMEMEILDTTFLNFPEMVVGWFEFFWMKDRSLDFDLEKLGKLFGQYAIESFFPSLPIDPENNLTKPIRAIVYDEVLPMDENDNVLHTLDYETALGVMDQAKSISVQDCPCRRQYSVNHPEKDHDYPLETCFAFDHHSHALSKVGLGRFVSKEEAKEIIKNVREHGMGSLVDNMKTPTLMCNCVKDSCVIYRGFHEADQKYMMNKSRFIPNLDHEKCVTCLTCVQRCPLELYEYDKETKKVEFNSELCWGCGVCSHFCPTEGALEMIERISIEEYADNISDTFLEFSARILVENERLHEMVCFDQQSKFHQMMLRPIVKKFATSKFGKDLLSKIINRGAQGWKKHVEKKKGKEFQYGDEEKGASFTNSWHKRHCEEDE